MVVHRHMKKLIAVLGLGALVFLATGCDKLKSRDAINKGIQSYRNARYTEAVEFFKRSVALDPTNVNGKLYLATAYMTQYVPASDNPKKVNSPTAPRNNSKPVLKKNPNK